MNQNTRWNGFSKRCIFLFFFLFVLTYFDFSNVKAADLQTLVTKTIRVVMDNNYPPYVFLNNDDGVQGILVDQWRLWEKKTGIRVEIKAMDWKDALEGMKAGKFDILDTAFITNERLSWLDFGKPYTRIEVSAFFNNQKLVLQILIP